MKDMKNNINAIDLIKQDHRSVEKLYREYKSAEGKEKERNHFADAICKSLEQHAKMEEKYFYPALREKTTTKGALRIVEALGEHMGVKALVKTVKNLPEGRVRSVTMKTLMDAVKHHVTEEELEMLPEAEKILGDEVLATLGRKMVALSPSEQQKKTPQRIAM